MKIKYYLAILAASIVISFILYGNTIPGEFVFDDQFFSTRDDLKTPNSLFKIWFQPLTPASPINATYRPLTTASFALNFILFGESTVSFHVVNILLNGIAVFLVFLVSLKIFKNNALAFFIALIFAFFPIHTSNVAWIKAREELLLAVFILLGWWLFIKATEEGNRINYGLAFLSSVMVFFAFLSKEFAVTAPALFLGTYLLRNKTNFITVLKLSLVFVPALAFYLLMLSTALGKFVFNIGYVQFIANPLIEEGLLVRIFTSFKILFTYVFKTFIPINLSATYYYNHFPVVKNILRSPLSLVGLGIVVIFVYLIWNRRTRYTPLGIGAFAFLISYLVFSQIIVAKGDMVSEHWIYFASIGLAFIGGFILWKLYSFKKHIAILALAIILTIYSVMIINRNLVWRSDYTLYHSMIRDASSSAKGYLNLASKYWVAGDFVQAKKYATLSYNIYENHSSTLYLLGTIEIMEGDYKKAENLFARVIKLTPLLVEAHINYMISLSKQHRFSESYNYAMSTFKKDFRLSQFRFLMAVNLYRLGKIKEAQEYFDWTNELSLQEKVKIIESF